MKIVGVIVEYNPLHNGHIHHINEIKRLANADVIVAVMSSTITMRGDLSLFDKFTKAKQALNNDIDIVIELPFSLGMHKADIFALNSVRFLNLLNVDEIWIGSEQNNPSIYEECYQAFKDKDEYIKQELKKGLSYKEITNSIYELSSNDLLGYTYYKAIKDNNYNIKLRTIQRINSNYLDINPTNDYIASALSIRNNINMIEKYCPDYVSNDIDNILNEELLFNFIKYKILSSTTLELSKIFFVDEGIENKLHDINNFKSLNEFVSYLETKRYTKTRIKRMLIYILLNVGKKEMNDLLESKIDYVRVLGYNEIGKKYLNKIKKDINIYTNIKEGINKVLDFEFRLTKIIDIIYNTDLLVLEQKGPQTKGI